MTIKKITTKPKYIYTIKDKHFPNFQVLNTANAWWLDRVKVEELIKAFKLDSTIEEACVYIGISITQYKYFIKLHSEFYPIKEACKEIPNLKARETVVSNIQKSYSNAMDYLSRKKKAEFSTRQEISQGSPKQFTKDEKEKSKKAIRGFGRGNS